MGTNYYLESLPCNECGHVKSSKHIGKSSCGWSFSFRGYHDSPRSYKEWLIEFEKPNTYIKDEYGDILTLSDFKGMVELKKDGLNHCRVVSLNPATASETIYLAERNYYYSDHARRCWVDPEGHSFCEEEFS